MIETTIVGGTSIEDWKPDVIKKDGTLYDWPFRPLVALKWFKNYFFAPVQLYHTGLALIVWFFLTPDLSRMQAFSWDWILTLYFRNCGLMFLVMGTVFSSATRAFSR